ncbi:AMP-binding protein [Desulfallas sp. Bu1-1]|uniref:class I adenylate-forming enzyme family protein n=1 Tax=Desulfallas sp. Bu1-1 TaxID=2787620 RepID=UPI00189D7C87|nr:AMP-binding protein [Desulfallas sp. Bu1-1]MBF7084308.1 AMP-binding protein [Desulfallas sp. Bu1-1]
MKEHKGYEGNIYVDYYIAVMREFSEKEAITCLTTNCTLTYGELDKITNQLNHKLRADGLQKNDVVMVCLFNTWHFPVSMLGSWKTPCIFSPINFRLAPGEIALHLEDSKPKVFIWDSFLDQTIKKALQLSKHHPQILLSTGESSVEGASKFEDYYKDCSQEDPDIEDRLMEVLDPFEDEIMRHYTSGTTGVAKGTVETSLAIMQMDWSIIVVNNVNWNDKAMNITPWFHQGGIILPTTILLSGGHLFGFPLTGFNPGVALDIIEKHKLTLVWGAPVTFNALAAEQRKKPRDLSSLRWICTMGSPLSKEEFLEWSEVLCKNIFNGYGTTETRMDLNLRSDIHPVAEKAGSAGRPVPFCQVRVIKVRPGERVEPYELVAKDGKEVGQVIAKSAHQFLGYYNRPELNSEKLYKGWFYSGDLATWDKDGFITIKGRTDDMIQSGAEKVYPVPVEECLMRHPKVKDAFVVPLPHEKWGQAVAAYVVPKEGEEITVEELDRHCVEDPYLANYTRPRYYQIVEEQMPYTATGKKLHYVMAERAKKEHEKFVPIPSEQQKS